MKCITSLWNPGTMVIKAWACDLVTINTLVVHHFSVKGKIIQYGNPTEKWFPANEWKKVTTGLL